MNKIKELKIAEAIERQSPPSFESEMVVKSVKGTLYLEEYKTDNSSLTKIPKKKTKAQKGIGIIAIRGFKYTGSLN